MQRMPTAGSEGHERAPWWNWWEPPPLASKRALWAMLGTLATGMYVFAAVSEGGNWLDALAEAGFFIVLAWLLWRTVRPYRSDIARIGVVAVSKVTSALLAIALIGAAVWLFFAKPLTVIALMLFAIAALLFVLVSRRF